MAFEFVLLDARCLAGFHRVDGFEHGLDTHGKHAVEIEGAERIGPADRRLLPQEDVASIEAVVGPEDRKTGLLGSMRQQAVTRLIQSSADTYQETWSAFNCDYSLHNVASQRLKEVIGTDLRRAHKQRERCAARK